MTYEPQKPESGNMSTKTDEVPPTDWAEVAGGSAEAGEIIPTGRPEAASTPARQRQKVGSGAVIERLLWQLVWIGVLILLIRNPWYFLIPAGLFLLWAMTLPGAVSGAFGTARWAWHKEMKAARLFGSSGLILGRALAERPGLLRSIGRLYTASLRDTRSVCLEMRAALLGRTLGGTPLIRIQHGCHSLLTVSPPGGGKTTCQVIPNLLVHSGSVVAVDTKGELFAATSRIRARRLGNHVVRLDPFRVLGRSGARLNPLDWINRDSPLVADQCMAIADALVVETGQTHDPHWAASARLALTAACLYVVAYAERKDRTVVSATSLVSGGQVEQPFGDDRDCLLGRPGA
jgi:hypothetical protein